MVSNYWATIELNDVEHKVFKNISELMHTSHSPKENNATLAIVLNSDEYSVDLKRKIVLNVPGLAMAFTWGFKNFEDQDLHALLEVLFAGSSQRISDDHLEILALNPAIVDSHGYTLRFFSTPHLVLRYGSYSYELIKRLIVQMIAVGTMTFPVAELILNPRAKDPFFSRLSIEIWSEIEKTIIEWARKIYDLGDVPDSWVLKMFSISELA